MRTLALLFALALFALASAAAAQVGPGPVVVAHYMPWFQSQDYSGNWGYHWTFNSRNPNVVGPDGQRQIASHYHPSIGPYDSRDPDLLEYHALLMRVAGVDGVVVDWYGTSSVNDYRILDEATGDMFDAAGRVGLKFAVCYEDATLRVLVNRGVITAAQAVGQARTDLNHVRDLWTGTPQTLTVAGAPVVLNFGPQYLTSSSQWASAFDGFATPPAFVTEDRRVAPFAAGAFPWPPMSLSVNGTLAPARLAQYLDSFYSGGASWPLTIGGAFTGFHDYYAQAGVGSSYGFLDDRGGQTLHETLARAATAGVPILQIATWNDFGEGTMIEPTAERGTRDLEEVQSTIRTWRPLPFQPADLALPERLYRLRKSEPLASTPRLDAAAALLAGGDPDGARRELDTFTASAETPGRTSLTVGPNPARGGGVVTLGLTLDEASDVQIDVFDAVGRRVARIADGRLGAGEQALAWEAAGQPSGVYVVRVRVGAERFERRVTLVR